jgi:hypothetical protein
MTVNRTRMKENGQIKNPGKWVETLIKDFGNRSPEILSRIEQMEKPGKIHSCDFQGSIIALRATIKINIT